MEVITDAFNHRWKKRGSSRGHVILQAAKTVGIEIPTLCYLEGISDIGSCRLCVVEVEGKTNLPQPATQKQKKAWLCRQPASV
mgnify:CR=1 FL=1